MAKNIAILGCGNMGRAVAVGIQNSLPEQYTFHTYTPSRTRAETLASELNGTIHDQVQDIPECDYYLIACKPSHFENLAAQLLKHVPKNAVIISVMASVSVDKIKRSLNDNGKIVRCMPNTPSIIGKGVTAIYFDPTLCAEEKIAVTNMLSSISSVVEFTEEKDIDLVTGVSGSGPAYVFEIARILVEKLTSMGISEHSAELLVRDMLFGASALLCQSDKSPVTLRNEVTTEKGITFEALKTLNEHGLTAAFSAAIDSAYRRTKELAQ